jgi:rSAM/selenodomain-associated transferase 1
MALEMTTPVVLRTCCWSVITVQRYASFTPYLPSVKPMESLGVFAKYWQPGRVKTRLAAAIGDESAAQLHRLFLRALLRRLEPLGYRHVLAFTPVERRDLFAAIGGEQWDLQSQGDGDLGERMHRFLANEVSAGAGRVVVLGSDSPSLPLHYVTEAFEQLRRVPVVLGPSDDGGYYLVGIASASGIPAIFDGISWGTPNVWQSTVERLRAAGIEYAELPRWYDVDQLPDLLRLRDELASVAPEDTVLATLRREVAEIVKLRENLNSHEFRDPEKQSGTES